MGIIPNTFDCDVTVSLDEAALGVNRDTLYAGEISDAHDGFVIFWI